MLLHNTQYLELQANKKLHVKLKRKHHKMNNVHYSREKIKTKGKGILSLKIICALWPNLDATCISFILNCLYFTHLYIP